MGLLNQLFEHNGYIKHRSGKTFYRYIFARKKKPGALPLVCLHGGPGSTHWSIHNMIDFANDRDVIFYDQIGCGFSDKIKKDKMKVTTFVEELHSLVKALKLKRFHLLGHSWGTMLELDYYLKYPDGIKSIVFSSPCVSASIWQADANRLIKKLPRSTQTTIYRSQKNKTTDTTAYKKAMDHYYKQFVLGDFIPTAHRFVGQTLRGKDVYHTMWGPSEFCATGNLRSYENYVFLPKIKVPTLFTCGKMDEATPSATRLYADLVPNSKFHIFKDSAHVPQNSEPKQYIRIIGSFLRENE